MLNAPSPNTMPAQQYGMVNRPTIQPQILSDFNALEDAQLQDVLRLSLEIAAREEAQFRAAIELSKHQK